MSLNKSHTPDAKGVLLFSGERIMLFSRKKIKLSFDGNSNPALKGTKEGSLYCTSHRLLFMADNVKNPLVSFSMPYVQMREVKLEQPLITPNYLKGKVYAEQFGNFEDCVTWKLTFPKGGCIEFGRLMLMCVNETKLVQGFMPPRLMSQGTMYYQPPPTYYMSPPDSKYQANVPSHIFNEQPPANQVFVYDAPPAYPGVADQSPYPAGNLSALGPGYQLPPNYQAPGYPTLPQGTPHDMNNTPGFPTAPNAPSQVGNNPQQAPPAYSAAMASAPPSSSGVPQYQNVPYPPNGNSQYQNTPSYPYPQAGPLPSKN